MCPSTTVDFLDKKKYAQATLLNYSRSWLRIMKKTTFTTAIICLLSLAFSACEEEPLVDSIPPSFLEVTLNPDLIYIYNTGSPTGVRLDPLVNDSIKIDVNLSFSTPSHGVINFIENEGWFYIANANFIGTDYITYTVCKQDACANSVITMQVEALPDFNNCTFSITGENVQTKKDKPIAIRIFDNDVVCPYMGSSIQSPEKGHFDYYTYSGTYKNTVYVYFPPKGFVGTDRFRYRLFTPDGYLETYCTITITE